MVSRSNSPRLIALLAWLVAASASAPLAAQTPAPITPLRLSFADAVRLASGEVPVVALATAHPAKFPDAVERATGLRPELPPHIADLMDRIVITRVDPARAAGVTARELDRLLGATR